jgi:hypothetical protein
MYRTKKADKVDPKEELLARWTRCHLSNELLQPPCVADELGSLYNKEAVVHALLQKALPPQLAHISSLKSLINLKLEPVPATAAGSSSNGKQQQQWRFQCPISGQEVNGRARFVIHRPTGWVISEKALKEVPAAAEEALGGKWTAADLVPVNPTGEELDGLRVKLSDKLAAEREKKAAKKAKKQGAVVAGAQTAAEASAAVTAPMAAGGSEGQRESVDEGNGGGNKRTAAAAAASDDGTEAAAVAAAVAKLKAKKLKLPEGATAQVYSSIFDRDEQIRETYCCRSVSGRTYV